MSLGKYYLLYDEDLLAISWMKKIHFEDIGMQMDFYEGLREEESPQGWKTAEDHGGWTTAEVFAVVSHNNSAPFLEIVADGVVDDDAHFADYW